MTEDSLLNFPQQFSQELEVQNAEEWEQYDRFLVGAMGGSALSASLFQILRPKLDFLVYRDYGLPELAEERWRNRLVVAN